MRTTHLLIAGVAAQVMAASAAHADFIEIYEDQDAWESALSEQESIYFTEVPYGTALWDQYLDQGVFFADGDDIVNGSSAYWDDAGVLQTYGLEMIFDEPRTAIAVQFPGGVQFALYSGGEEIYLSSPAGASPSAFFGILSDQPFDSAIAFNPAGGISSSIDDLFFGNVIPAPGAMALFGVAAISMRRRRRRASAW